MKKPRIFISIHYLEIGGAETSLIGLLNAIDYKKVDVDLFVYSHQGPLMSLIPSEVNLLPEIIKYTTTEKSVSDVIRMGFIDVAIARLFAKCKYKIFRKLNPSNLPEDSGLYQYMSNHVTQLLPKIMPHTNYDLAINFCGMHNVVLDKVNAKRKVAWIHTDYSKVDTNRKVDLKQWNRFDSIISISSDVSKTFCEVYPSLSNKLIVIENIISPEYVKERSTTLFEPMDIDKKDDEIILLSIGRYSPAKNFENIPFITKKIIEEGINNLKWFIIGYGDDSLIRQNIEESKMDRHVFLLGKRENPYPYIVSCDFYVQPSLFEGKSVTVREAQILGKPVIITNYPTAKSQVRDGVDGFIVSLDNEECAKAIAKIMRDNRALETVTSNLKRIDFGNKDEVKKIYDLIPNE